VENSLDAAEAIHVLPVVKVKVKEYSEENHNTRHGIKKKFSAGKSVSSSLIDTTEEGDEFSLLLSQSQHLTQTSTGESELLSQPAAGPGGGGKKARKSLGGEAKELMYYEISVEDNGCGIKEKDISHLLGKVLSGSKHGVRQTRGKFGLGSKMVLVLLQQPLLLQPLLLHVLLLLQLPPLLLLLHTHTHTHTRR
jgi:DNA topoisomerase VI subunit B